MLCFGWIYCLLAGIVGAFAVSCNVLEPTESQTVGSRVEMEFSACMDTSSTSASKVHIEDAIHVSWDASDCISVCEGIAEASQKGAVFTTEESGPRVTFRGLLPERSNYYAVYPSSAVRYWKEDGSAVAYTILKKQQLALKGTVDPDALIMCAKTSSSSKSFAFKTAVALVKFTVTQESSDIVSITANAPDQYIVGSSAVNTSYSSPYLVGTGAKASSVTLAKADDSVFEPGDYYLALIPRTYSSLEFCFKNAEGQSCVKTMSGVTLKAGTVYPTGDIPSLFGDSLIETYRYSSSLSSSELYSVQVCGENQFVFPTDEPHICTFGARHAVDVLVSKKGVVPESVDVRPLGKNYNYSIEGENVRITLSPYDRVSVEINGETSSPLFIFVNPLETNRPSKDDSDVLYYSAGYYRNNASGTNLTNQGKKVLYLEGGAVLKTNVAIQNDSDVEIRGYGIIDAREGTAVALNVSNSSNISISGVILLNASEGSTRFTQSSNIKCDNYKVVATASQIMESGVENDAFDFFGSHNAEVTRCFGYCHDDVFIVASKSLKRGWGGPTYGIRFEDCVGWNERAGNTFEIGYATALDVNDVTFKNCYSIHSNTNRTSTSWYTKGAMAVHSCSYGTVSNVTFDNIFIEDPHCYSTVLEIKKSPFDDLPGYEGGHIRNVLFKDIHILKDGPDHSSFKGYNADHAIDGVRFINYNVEGVKASSASEARITTLSNAYDLSFDGAQAINPRGIQTYCYSSELSPSDRYQVSVAGVDQFVYPSTTIDTYDEQLHVCQFGCRDYVQVKLRLKDGTATSYAVRPLSLDFSSSLSSGELSLKMKPGDRAIVELDGDYMHPLMLFANEIEDNVNTDATYFFRAGGVYSPNQITLNTGESIYIEGGAVVKTTVRSNQADNISITGAGILDASQISAYTLHLRRFKGLTIKGITAIGRDAALSWLASGEQLTIDNYKAMALFSRKNTSGNENDALDLVGCAHARVSRGFSYSHDDCCIVKSNASVANMRYEGASFDIVVDDHISAYRDTGHGCGIGYSCFDDIHDVTFRNIYVPYESPVRTAGSRKGQLAVHNVGNGSVSGITFENVWLEQASKGQGIFMGIFKYGGHDYGDTGYVPGQISGITFKNIHMDAAPAYGNYILGYGEGNRITDVTFDGLYYGNRKITNRSDAMFTDGLLGGYNRTRFSNADEPIFK